MTADSTVPEADPTLFAAAEAWLADDPDASTRAELAAVLEAARSGMVVLAMRRPRLRSLIWPTGLRGCCSSARPACVDASVPVRTG